MIMKYNKYLKNSNSTGNQYPGNKSFSVCQKFVNFISLFFYVYIYRVMFGKSNVASFSLLFIFFVLFIALVLYVDVIFIC